MAALTRKKRSIREKGEKTKKHRSNGTHNRTYKRNITHYQTTRRGGVNNNNRNENNNGNDSNRNSGYNNYSNLSQHLFEGPVSPLSRNDKRWIRITNAFLQTRPHDVPEEFFENVMDDVKMMYTLSKYEKWRLDTFAFDYQLRYSHHGRKHVYNLFKVFDYIKRKYSQMQRRMDDKLWETNAKLHRHLNAEWAMLVNERRDRILQHNDINHTLRNRRPFPASSKEYQTYLTRYYKSIENTIYQDPEYSNNSNVSNNNTNSD